MRRRTLTSYDTIDVNNYLTMEALEDNFQVSFSKTVEYSVDGKGGKTLSPNTQTPIINTGHTISFKADAQPTRDSGVGTFSTTSGFKVYGNYMSMLYGDVVEEQHSLYGKEYAFYKLFAGCSLLYEVSNDFLHATELSDYCYSHMFEDCSGLEIAPELPATELASYCYSYMFSGCYNITPPYLPATVLYPYCYERMFEYCRNLEYLPNYFELPATELAEGCYSGMFNKCVGLSSLPYLPATTLAPYCYEGMFCEVNPNCFDDEYELPAMDLEEYCYCGMFSGISDFNISNIKLPATTLAPYCYSQMFGSSEIVDASGLELPANDLAEGCYYQMFSYCLDLEQPPSLPAINLAPSCYEEMFRNDYSLTTAPELPAMDLEERCYYGMFNSCNVEYAELPAEELVGRSCYSYMFYGVRNFTLKAMFTTTPSNEYLYGGLSAMDNYMTLILNPNITWDPADYIETSLIPDDATIEYAS